MYRVVSITHQLHGPLPVGQIDSLEGGSSSNVLDIVVNGLGYVSLPWGEQGIYRGNVHLHSYISGTKRREKALRSGEILDNFMYYIETPRNHHFTSRPFSPSSSLSSSSVSSSPLLPSSVLSLSSSSLPSSSSSNQSSSVFSFDPDSTATGALAFAT